MTTERILANQLPASIIAERRGRVGWLVFNDVGRHNAISLAMWQAVPVALAAFVEDPSIRAIVLTGAGDKAFVSGANIEQFEGDRTGAEALARYDESTGCALDAIYACAKPTIARVRGHCIGGGVSIAVACDVRIASAGSRFAIPAARLGLGYRLSAMRDLVTLIGPGNTLDIFLSARPIDAARAGRIGLVQHVIDDAGLDDFVTEYLASVCGGAPLTLRTTKAMVRALRSLHPGVDEAAMKALVNACFESDDYREGKRAFAEKRPPVFAGR